jgi:carbon storage regulator CsrA
LGSGIDSPTWNTVVTGGRFYNTEGNVLVLSRKTGQSIRIDGPCVVTICEIHERRVVVGIDAAPSVKIARDELAPLSPPSVKPVMPPLPTRNRELED